MQQAQLLNQKFSFWCLKSAAETFDPIKSKLAILDADINLGLSTTHTHTPLGLFSFFLPSFYSS